MFAEPVTVTPHVVDNPRPVRLKLPAEFDEMYVQCSRVRIERFLPDALV
jgi:hypothetical protein